jgi:hypothetical protein
LRLAIISAKLPALVTSPRSPAFIAARFPTIGSISPLVILILAIVSLVFNKNAAEAQLLAKVQELVGTQGRESREN